jgi:hypothetical protein
MAASHAAARASDLTVRAERRFQRLLDFIAIDRLTGKDDLDCWDLSHGHKLSGRWPSVGRNRGEADVRGMTRRV